MSDGVTESTLVTIYPTITPTVVSGDHPEAVHITNTSTQPVPVNITASSLGTRFRPRFTANVVDVTIPINTTITVFSFTGDGQIDMISVEVKDEKDCFFELYVDGTLIYSINLKELKEIIKHHHDWQSFMFTHHGHKKFIDLYHSPVDFNTSFQVKVKNASLTKANKVKNHLIRYREKI